MHLEKEISFNQIRLWHAMKSRAFTTALDVACMLVRSDKETFMKLIANECGVSANLNQFFFVKQMGKREKLESNPKKENVMVFYERPLILKNR